MRAKWYTYHWKWNVYQRVIGIYEKFYPQTHLVTNDIYTLLQMIIVKVNLLIMKEGVSIHVHFVIDVLLDKKLLI